MDTAHKRKKIVHFFIFTGIFLLLFTYQSYFSIHDSQKTFVFSILTKIGEYDNSRTLVQKICKPNVFPRTKWNAQCNGRNKYALIVYFQQRLGNNIFQVASSLGIAYRNGLVPVYPERSYHVFKMFNLTLNLQHSLPDSCKKYKTFNYSQNNHAVMYDQHTEALGYISQHQKSNIRLKGYWENEKYFKNIKAEIRKQFQFTDVIKREAEKFLEEQMEVRFKHQKLVKVGVHIRLTDRRTKWKVNGTEYIQKAISFYQRHYVHLLFVVCSDDIAAARKLFPQNINIIYSERFRDKPWLDLAVLTLCDHSIITVGTFGWWSAWLTGGKVVYLHKINMWGFKISDDTLTREHYLEDWVPL